MPGVLPLILLLLAAGPSPSSPIGDGFTTIESFLADYARVDAGARDALARSYFEWQRGRGGFPVVHPDGSVIFLYLGSGAEREVRLIGDFRTRGFNDVYWDEAGEAMSRVAPDGGLFVERRRFENDARLDYAFNVDGEHRLDPLNPAVVDSGIIGKACELVMPGYRRSPAATRRQDVPGGTLRVVDEGWAKPKFTIYLPAGYDASNRYPVVYTADGSAWIDIIGLPVILDNLIADGAIAPVIAVMIDAPEDRSRWYYYNPDYLAYLEKVVAYVDGRYSTKTGPGDRLHVGSSSGGRASLYVGIERPGLFRNLAMLSPSLTGPIHYLEPYFGGTRRPDARLKIWLSAGTYEGYIYKDAETLESYFKKVGLKTKAVYTHEGHSFGAWRNLTADMLSYFLTRASARAPGLLAAAGTIIAHPPPKPDPGALYLFYLHGRIVQEQGRGAVSPKYGTYEYDAIVRRFADAGFVVISEIRPRGSDVKAYAEYVANRIGRLLDAGVPARRITVVGASMGGIITMQVSNRRSERDLGYVIMGCCDRDTLKLGGGLHGDVLSIYEVSDEGEQSCAPQFTRAGALTRHAEIRLDTRLGHGFLFRPLPEWIDPIINRARERGEWRRPAPEEKDK